MLYIELLYLYVIYLNPFITMAQLTFKLEPNNAFTLRFGGRISGNAVVPKHRSRRPLQNGPST